jgi:branched-chain amino acid transport system permease protein
LTGIPRDVIGIPGLLSIPISENMHFYYFCAAIFILAAIIKYKLIHSHFGQVLKTIRENETRARMVGYNVRKYKLASFIISAIYAAVAGTLYGLFLNYMFPQTLDWIRSGDVVIMSLIGGMGTFFGPIIGAGVVVALRVLISIYAKIEGLVFWQLFMGAIFLIFVLFVFLVLSFNFFSFFFFSFFF